MEYRTPIVAAILVFAAAPAVRGQQPALQVPAVLSLEDAKRIARQNSPTYLQTLNESETSAMGVRQAWAAFLPSLGASLIGFNMGSSTTSIGEGDFGQTVETPSITVKSSGASQGLSLNATLFDGGAIFKRLSQARAQENVTYASIDFQASELNATVTSGFYSARQAAMLVDVELRNLQTARDRFERNQELFRIAGIDQVGLIESERGVISAQQSLRRQESEAEKQRLTLGQTLGIDGSIEFEIAAEVPQVFDPTTINVSNLVARAVSASPVVRQRLASVEAAKQNIGVAKGGRWPTISAGFGYNRSAGEAGFGAVGNFNPNDRNGWSFNIGASLQLFTRFQTSAAISAAQVQHSNSALNLRSARLQVEQAMRSGMVDLQRAYAEYLDAERIAELSGQQVELAEQQFRVGALDYLRFQQIVDANAQAQRQVVLSRFAFVNSRVAIERALGTPINR